MVTNITPRYMPGRDYSPHRITADQNGTRMPVPVTLSAARARAASPRLSRPSLAFDVIDTNSDDTLDPEEFKAYYMQKYRS